MSEFSHISFYENYRNRVSGLIENSLAINSKQKSEAHDRIFKLVISLTTLFLTAWVGLVTAKFQTAVDHICVVVSSCGLLLFSVILTMISDFMIVLQSKYNEEINQTEVNTWMTATTGLEAKLAGVPSENVGQTIVESLRLFEGKLTEIGKDKKVKKSKMLYKWSWILGISGFILFIFSICWSMYQIPVFFNFVQGK